ncbi:hypothetical protein CPT_Privateer_034 [Proteus phage Privateer]|uniref:YspA cpYpsA-related SLOG domain-containing protein n=1 Tax=Proteus phage Privateer TaxID=2712958 RepID=A0A6G8R3P6_9CAUD|nr:GTP-binding domain [Proteus phage Privateer]QIN94827.1 hypothetical protein CPT_Privateer_034 [Proteus phage Privateer]
MKVIIAGSRDLKFSQLSKMFNLVNKDHNILKNTTEIVSGNARGADRFGELLAEENEIKLTVFKPDWDQYGKSAGYIRNAEMGKYADMGVILWDGVSKGSLHMYNYLVRNEIPVILVTIKEDSTKTNIDIDSTYL